MKILPFLLAFCILIIPSAFAEEKVPSWIKNTADWWASALINDNEFVNAIEFLIKEGIIQVDAKAAGEKSDNIPDWIRNTAGWWATDQISETEFLNAIEFLIESGIISISNYNCDQNEDQDRNGVPDIIEEAPILTGMTTDQYFEVNTDFINKNWSNCYFPKDLSFYAFENVDLSYSDFSDAKLFNTIFNYSNLQGADFSNVNIQGSVFLNTVLSYTNFESADFSADNWEEPFLVFSYINKEKYNDAKISAFRDLDRDLVHVSGFNCYYTPCTFHYIETGRDLDNSLYAATFGHGAIPLNLKFTDAISDKSDYRTIWRHHPSFVNSDITGTIFTKSDLAYATFSSLDINSVDFTDVNLSNALFQSVNFTEVKSTDNLLNGAVDSKGITYPANIELDAIDQNISIEKFETLRNLGGDDFNIVFDHALDYPPINWSMGMTIYDEKLYVADTDNHRIIVYDLENDEKLLTFTSPMQEHCETVVECELKNRNLPSSITIIDDKIFVAYGWQDNIQVFDLGGNYLYKFGSSGINAGQFNTPYRLTSLNNELFVADYENYLIQVFDLDGNFLREFGTYNEISGQHSKPLDVAIYNSQIFVVDQIEALILVFDLNGEFIKELPVNQNDTNTSEPYGVFVYDGLIFVSDVGDSSVKIFDLDGNLVKQFGQYGDRYGEFKHPSLAITDGNRIFVSDAENHRIQIFNILP